VEIMAQIDKFKLLIAFIIGNILFLGGFMASSWIILSESQRNLALQQEIHEQITFMDSQTEFYCANYNPGVSIELNEAGSFLTLLEKKLGKNSPEIISQKENYSLLELKHFYSIKSYMQKCDKALTTILFFYSNQEDFIDDAETKGFIISKLKELYPETVMVYSFDYDLNSDVIRNLKSLYNIQKPNTIIINEAYSIDKLDDIDQFKPYL